MNKVNAIRLRQEDGLSDEIPISTTVENIMYDSSTNMKTKTEEIIALINQLQQRPIKDENNILVF